MTIQVNQGDANYPLIFTIQDSTGAIVNLTSTTQYFKAQLQGTSFVKVSGTMQSVAPTTGVTQYIVQSGDFNISGNYFCEVQVVYQNGEILTFGGFNVQANPVLPMSF